MENGELRNKKFPWKPERNKKTSLTIHTFNLSVFFQKSTGSSSLSASSQLGLKGLFWLVLKPADKPAEADLL